MSRMNLVARVKGPLISIGRLNVRERRRWGITIKDEHIFGVHQGITGEDKAVSHEVNRAERADRDNCSREQELSQEIGICGGNVSANCYRQSDDQPCT